MTHTPDGAPGADDRASDAAPGVAPPPQGLPEQGLPEQAPPDQGFLPPTTPEPAPPAPQPEALERLDEAPVAPDAPLLRTPLHDAHRARGGRMVPFAGYAMPVQYAAGILTEHGRTRTSAGLFDVSHMGQAFLIGPDHATTAAALEALVPSEIMGLAPGRQRYALLLGEDGGVLDDLMVARPLDEGEDGVLMLVVNASNAAFDFAHIASRLPANVRLLPAPHRALLALQGPRAAEVLARLAPEAAAMRFMDARDVEIAGARCAVTRSGYTGEDGYEISVHARSAERLWDALLAHPEVEACGLGARDSLRLEAGLPLHGHDVDATTSPVEAALAWSIGKRRREEGGFPGYDRIARELRDGPSRLRVGLRPEGRQPVREGAEVLAGGRVIGRVTSGGYGPTANGPVAMGYVEAAFAAPGTPLAFASRGREVPGEVAALPFVPQRYHRG